MTTLYWYTRSFLEKVYKDGKGGKTNKEGTSLSSVLGCKGDKTNKYATSLSRTLSSVLEKDLRKKCFFCGNKWYTNYTNYPFEGKSEKIDIFVCRRIPCQTMAKLQVIGHELIKNDGYFI